MDKIQVDFFRAMRKGDLTKARKAYDKGANINWPMDRWMIGGRQHWGQRVQVKPFGVYMGFSAREAWEVPDGEGADRGDTFIMIALKCRDREAVAFLVGCNRLNRNCLNEAGNSATDIARATSQEFLMRGDPAPAMATAAGPSEFEEALPAWEQDLRAQGAAGVHPSGTGDMPFASVVAEPLPLDGRTPEAHGNPAAYATAEAVGDASYAQTGHATVAPVHVATPIQGNNTGVAVQPQDNPHQPYNSRNAVQGGGGGRYARPRRGTGVGAVGAFGVL